MGNRPETPTEALRTSDRLAVPVEQNVNDGSLDLPIAVRETPVVFGSAAAFAIAQVVPSTVEVANGHYWRAWGSVCPWSRVGFWI